MFELSEWNTSLSLGTKNKELFCFSYNKIQSYFPVSYIFFLIELLCFNHEPQFNNLKNPNKNRHLFSIDISAQNIWQQEYIGPKKSKVISIHLEKDTNGYITCDLGA